MVSWALWPGQSRCAAPLMRKRAEWSWRLRWGSILSCAARAVASSLLELPRASNGADGEVPHLHEVERDRHLVAWSDQRGCFPRAGLWFRFFKLCSSFFEKNSRSKKLLSPTTSRKLLPPRFRDSIPFIIFLCHNLVQNRNCFFTLDSLFLEWDEHENDGDTLYFVPELKRAAASGVANHSSVFSSSSSSPLKEEGARFSYHPPCHLLDNSPLPVGVVQDQCH